MPRWSRRPDARPGELLAIALECFSRDGIEAVSLDRIARQAGVTKGTFYHYFTSKDHLLGEILKSYAAPRAQELLTLAQGDEPAPQRLEQLLRRHWLLLSTTPLHHLPRLLITAAPRHPKLARLAMRHGIGAVQAAYGRCLADGQADGTFRAIAPQAAVELCVLPIIARCLMADSVLEEALSPADTFIDSHCTVVLSALRSAPGRRP